MNAIHRSSYGSHVVFSESGNCLHPIRRSVAFPNRACGIPKAAGRRESFTQAAAEAGRKPGRPSAASRRARERILASRLVPSARTVAVALTSVANRFHDAVKAVSTGSPNALPNCAQPTIDLTGQRGPSRLRISAFCRSCPSLPCNAPQIGYGSFQRMIGAPRLIGRSTWPYPVW